MMFALLVAAAQACGPTSATGDQDAAGYAALVRQAVEDAREGRRTAAVEAFDRAIAQCPGRPEAWIERGGLHFLESRYREAVLDLERALRLREDPYVRSLLASSLHLDGRPDEALGHWNAIGQPRLRALTVLGLRHTRDAVARREIALQPDQVVTVDSLRFGRLRLGEVGVFAGASLRVVPAGDGTADVEAALVERHGLASSPVAFALELGMHLLQERARLRYDNLSGDGISLTAEHRWQRHRPRTAVAVSWPRPLGVPAFLHARGWRGRQSYSLRGETRSERSRGAELALRGVMGPRWVAEMGFRLGRSSAGSTDVAVEPLLLGAAVGMEALLSESRLYQLKGHLRVSGTARPQGAGRGFARVEGGVLFRRELTPAPAGTSRLVASGRAAFVGASAPLADRFAVGASPEMTLALRGRPLIRQGVADGALVARSCFLLNLEWRRRLVGIAGLTAGLVVFHDGARLGGTLEGPPQRLHDVGAGLRLALGEGLVLRVDYGRGLTDGRQALSFGLGQAF